MTERSAFALVGVGLGVHAPFSRPGEERRPPVRGNAIKNPQEFVVVVDPDSHSHVGNEPRGAGGEESERFWPRYRPSRGQRVRYLRRRAPRQIGS